MDAKQARNLLEMIEDEKRSHQRTVANEGDASDYQHANRRMLFWRDRFAEAANLIVNSEKPNMFDVFAEQYKILLAKHIEVHSVWKHLKSGRDYRVTGFCVQEKDLALCVLYQRCAKENATQWSRPLTEFMDGRFEQISKAIK